MAGGAGNPRRSRQARVLEHPLAEEFERRQAAFVGRAGARWRGLRVERGAEHCEDGAKRRLARLA